MEEAMQEEFVITFKKPVKLRDKNYHKQIHVKASTAKDARNMVIGAWISRDNIKTVYNLEDQAIYG